MRNNTKKYIVQIDINVIFFYIADNKTVKLNGSVKYLLFIQQLIVF